MADIEACQKDKTVLPLDSAHPLTSTILTLLFWHKIVSLYAIAYHDLELYLLIVVLRYTFFT